MNFVALSMNNTQQTRGFAQQVVAQLSTRPTRATTVLVWTGAEVVTIERPLAADVFTKTDTFRAMLELNPDRLELIAVTQYDPNPPAVTRKQIGHVVLAPCRVDLPFPRMDHAAAVMRPDGRIVYWRVGEMKSLYRFWSSSFGMRAVGTTTQGFSRYAPFTPRDYDFEAVPAGGVQQLCHVGKKTKN